MLLPEPVYFRYNNTLFMMSYNEQNLFKLKSLVSAQTFSMIIKIF